SSKLEAYQANRLISSELGRGNTAPTTSTFDLIFKSDTLSVSDEDYKAAVKAALEPIQSDSRVVSIVTPYSVSGPAAQSLTSRDGHEALVIVEINAIGQKGWPVYNDLRAKVHSATLSVTGTGFLAINQSFNTTLESDLQRAETVTLPVTLILLIIIFASVVAAGLPLGVGIVTIVGGIGGTFFLNRFTDVSQYAINIVTLIGLGVSIDYSLFIVNRFRDELAAGASREDAIATTMATAGRAITFSGLTVAVGLSAMLFFQGTFMASMGAAGAIVVAVAVFYALTVLPALLSLIGPAVNRWRVPSIRRSTSGRGFWRGLATWVMKRPVLVLVPTVAFLVIAGTPFLQIRLANGNVDMLPERLEARQGYDRLVADFPGQDQTNFSVVVDYPDGSPLTASRIADQYTLTRRIANIPGVQKVNSIYNLDPQLGLFEYQRLYTGDPNNIPQQARQFLDATVGEHVVLITATTNAEQSSDAARDILKAIRGQDGIPDGRILVGGATAIDVDVITFIYDRVPLAVGTVVVVTYVLLFLLTGSVVLPLKAVILNFLSIGASFGALVYIFQQGHFADLLAFTPQSLDPSIPVILFSIVFGLSMDYEVLLVSRMHEEYVRLGDNTAAVASGLEKTGRLITGAAAIMFTVFMAFGLAEVVIIKAIGIGLAIAVAIDATIVRSLVVPAVMRLLGDVNWWAPRPLRRLYDRIGLGDIGVAPDPRSNGHLSHAVALLLAERDKTEIPVTVQ
ncbi:MAG TPA: MMPL family transporter, partial [Candidatus Dormibacteraeota bacterium]|nr:MMPL family transporter [Candidatus Dormibacteraeota bacterium]